MDFFDISSNFVPPAFYFKNGLVKFQLTHLLLVPGTWMRRFLWWKHIKFTSFISFVIFCFWKNFCAQIIFLVDYVCAKIIVESKSEWEGREKAEKLGQKLFDEQNYFLIYLSWMTAQFVMPKTTFYRRCLRSLMR